MDRHDNYDDIQLPVGSKLRHQRGSMMRESVSAPVSDFARAQLERMGWTEGTGLGKRHDGMTTHIKVKQRKEASGLGSEKLALVQQKEAQEAWWMDALGSTLAKLGGGGVNQTAAQPRRVTDEELFAATGGARFGMRAGKTRNLDKWKRVDDHPATTATTTTTTTTSSTTTTNHTNKSEPRHTTTPRTTAKCTSGSAPLLNGVDDDEDVDQQQTKKRKARDNVDGDVAAVEKNIVAMLDNNNEDQKKWKKSHKRPKKEKKSKPEKKMKKDKKREKRER